MFRALTSFLVIATLSLTSCAFHSGYLAPSASLSQANFNYAQTNISGRSSVTYVIGIGGMGRKTLVNDAKKDMLAQHPLRNNQALANVTVNFKESLFILPIVTVECIVTADVVEFSQMMRPEE